MQLTKFLHVIEFCGPRYFDGVRMLFEAGGGLSLLCQGPFVERIPVLELLGVTSIDE